MKIPRFPAALILNATFTAFGFATMLAVAQDVTPAAAVSSVPAAGKFYLSSGAADVLKLAHAKVNDDVTIAFIQSSNRRYDLSADEILYLRKEGVSDRVLTAMLGQQPAPAAAAAPPPAQPASTEATATYASAPEYVTPPATTPVLETVPVSTVYVTTTPAYYSFCDPWPCWSTWCAYPAFSIGFYWGWGWGNCGWGYPSYCYNGYWNNYCNNGYPPPPPPPPAGNPPPPGNRPPPVENRPPQSGSTPLIAEGRQPSGVSRGAPLVAEMRQPSGVSGSAPLVSEMRQPSGVSQSAPLISEGRQPSGVASANQATTRNAVTRVENRSALSARAAQPTSHWSGNNAQASAPRPVASPRNQTFSAGRGEVRSTGAVGAASRSAGPANVWSSPVNPRPAAPTYVNRSAGSVARPSNVVRSPSSGWSQPYVAAGSRSIVSRPSVNYSRGAFRPSTSYRGSSFNSVSRPSMGASSSFRGGSSFSGMSAPRMSAGGGGFRGGGGRTR